MNFLSSTSGYFFLSMRMTHNYCSLSSIVAIINMQPSSFHNSNRPNGWIRSRFRLLLKRLQTVFQRKHTRSSFRANNLCVYKSTKQRGPSPSRRWLFPRALLAPNCARMALLTPHYWLFQNALRNCGDRSAPIRENPPDKRGKQEKQARNTYFFLIFSEITAKSGHH